MSDQTYLNWPFFEDCHRKWSQQVEEFVAGLSVDHNHVDACCRDLVRNLGESGLLKATSSDDGTFDELKLCLIRDTLAHHNGLGDFSFAMQGLGTGALTLFGSEVQKNLWLPLTRSGQAISDFALTEPGSRSDVANSKMTAKRDGNDYILNGEKTWISNGGIADIYTVFARTGEAPGARGLSTFVISPEVSGFAVKERLQTITPHLWQLCALRIAARQLPP